ncbi:MAG TPA: nucleotide exchange factor GrpE [Actinomycetota bacterium]|nr:nucleotide exchange factor GrpE [Actinomycetota bacterium]
MTDERERDEEQPRVRITDRRRFADLREGDAPAEQAGASPGSDQQDATSEQEAAGVAGDLVSAQGEAQQYLDHLRRLQAEFDNYRKRVVKEQTELAELGAMPVMRRLLEVLDDFELALMSAEDQPDFERFLKGIELVYAKLFDALKAEGLERVHAEGAPFDPELHEALMQTGDGQGDPVVADVLRPGYTLRGRVLRPAGVRVERTD